MLRMKFYFINIFSYILYRCEKRIIQNKINATFFLYEANQINNSTDFIIFRQFHIFLIYHFTEVERVFITFVKFNCRCNN